MYDFNPGDMTLLPGEKVVVETARGLEYGEVARANRTVTSISQPLKPVVRRANADDLRRMAEHEAKARHAMQVCQERILLHGLDMKLVDAEYAYDESKITFDFTAEGRVDFRNLVKDLAAVFHTRIELHQIGVRDEAKKLGGVGICGQPFCCSRFLKDFQPVSIKMAKEQGLSLNPTKISGSCGRLMCCLKYEQDTYEELLRLSPKVGAVVMTPEGRGVVTDSNVLTGKLKVRLDKAPDSPAVDMMREDVTVVIRDKNAGGKPAPAGDGNAPAKNPPQAKPQQPAKNQPPKQQPAKAQQPKAPSSASKEAAQPSGEQKGNKGDSRPRNHRPRNKRQG